MKGPLSLFSVFRLCETTLASIALVIPMRIMANDYANQRAPEIDLPPGRPREDSPIPPSQTRIRQKLGTPYLAAFIPDEARRR